jgi:hypothetical protein
LKKPDSDADFVFMGDLHEAINQAGRMSRFIWSDLQPRAKSLQLF